MWVTKDLNAPETFVSHVPLPAGSTARGLQWIADSIFKAKGEEQSQKETSKATMDGYPIDKAEFLKNET